MTFIDNGPVVFESIINCRQTNHPFDVYRLPLYIMHRVLLYSVIVINVNGLGDI